jgi:hypothetical protein
MFGKEEIRFSPRVLAAIIKSILEYLGSSEYEFNKVCVFWYL